MLPAKQFTGLSMPVFTAFGWAGEETALNFALSQLEAFIQALQVSLPRELQALFPHAGLDRAGQSVYLATGEDVESNVYFAFYARPNSFEITLALTDKKALAKGLKAAEAAPEIWHRLVTELGPEWNLRLQQMEYDEDSGSATHYQDLFKDSVVNLDPETAASTIVKAAFLNGEGPWVTPIYISRRIDAEQVAAMGTGLLEVMSKQVEQLMPLFRMLTGQVRKPAAKSRTKTKAAPKEKIVEALPEISGEPLDQFTYVSELKPLHIQRGFVNLTSHHWSFFALNARTETRPVTIYYDGRYDHKSAVWRLVPDDQARIVLSPPVQEWLENNFGPEDRIQITARKLDEQEIQLALTHAS